MCAPGQKTTTTRNRSMVYSLLTWWEQKTPPIGQWREAIEQMSSKVGFSKFIDGRQVACTSFELVWQLSFLYVL